jgi:hypothetical protein
VVTVAHIIGFCVSHLLGILKSAGVAGLDEAALPSRQKQYSLVSRLRGRVPADVIANTLARALNALVMPLSGREADLLGAPTELLVRRRLLPLGQVIEGGVRFAVVGASDPTDDVGVAELVTAIGMPVRLVLVNDDDLERLFGQLVEPTRTTWQPRQIPLLDADDSVVSDDSDAGGDYDLDEGPTRIEPVRLPEEEAPSLVMLGASNIDSVTPLTDDHHAPETAAGPSASSSVFTNTPVSAVDSTEGTDLDEGPTTRLEAPRIMLVISSSDALVSATDAACWTVPDESEALDSETLRAAEAVSVALRSRSMMAAVMLAIVRFHSRSMTWRARLLACITHHARPATSRNPPRRTVNSSLSRHRTSLAADFSSAALVCVANTTA